jgi:glutamate/tyrosine decarboxylase-like PLP-dependent enzyme
MMRGDAMAPRPALPDRSELAEVIELAARVAHDYFAGVDERLARNPASDAAARAFDGPFPESGEGALAALRELVERGLDATVTSAGPRFFHWVIGGSTPAALGGDWIATTLDQLSSGWPTSPLATQLELTSFRWLCDLFGLNPSMAGYMTTGAMMANYTGLAAARQWCGEQQGVDVAQQGLAALEPIPVFSSGLVHVTSSKALAMLGLGRAALARFARDRAGRLDEDALAAALAARRGRPSIVIANAGEVNAGLFDPIARMAELAKRHGAWLHVDGAFGLFCRATPRTAHLAEGVERADSVTADGHKWLNVPYDCGFSFVRDAGLSARVFSMDADYLPGSNEREPVLCFIGPDSSRRARSLSVWATLRAYGRAGVRRVVEGHLDLAQHLARRVDESPRLERLAEVPLNIVCFRYNPRAAGQALSDDALDRLNAELGDRIIRDGRVYVGKTLFEGRVALRPAIVNWRTAEADLDLLVEVVEELGAAIATQ